MGWTSAATAVAASVISIIVLAATCWPTQNKTFVNTLGVVREEFRPHCNRTLVVHVGPWKTGTTSMQSFLVQQAKWLEQEFGVFVGMRGEPKGAAYLPWTIHYKFQNKTPDCFYCADDTTFAERVADIRAHLLKKQAFVVVSAEDFSSLSLEQWFYFKSLFANMPGCLSIVPVVFIRHPTSWYRSMWVENNKAGVPATFLQYIFGPLFGGNALDRFGDADFQLALLNKLQHVFGSQAVQAASYEGLLARNLSAATFLVCNATLHHKGAKWSRCKDFIMAKHAHSANISPPAAALDVVRLAFDMHGVRQINKPCNAEFRLRAVDANVIQVANQMPQLCGTLDAFFTPALDKWYHQSRAPPPDRKYSAVCSVDEKAMTPHHWQLIQSLLPKCEQ